MDEPAGRWNIDAHEELGPHRLGELDLRILHLGTDSYGGYGGIALYNRDLISAMAAHPDVEEVVVIPRLIGNPLEPLPPKVTFVAHAARGRLAFLNALHSYRQRFDLVVCAHVNLLPIARLVTKTPLLWIYGIEAWKPLRDPFSVRLLREIRHVVSISEITRERFCGWSGYDRDVHLLPNAIHAEQYGMRPTNPELATRYGLDGKRALLTLGRVVAAERYKGFDEMIDLLPDLERDVAYIVAGGGNDIARLAAKAARLHVKDRVIFTGLFPERLKEDIYNLADVYVMPSRGEGFGFVFLEAMACGLPAIGSKLDGGREALRNGKLGRLVDPTSKAEIRAAVGDALAAGLKQIPPGLDHFSYANFERRAHDIIDSVAANA